MWRRGPAPRRRWPRPGPGGLAGAGAAPRAAVAAVVGHHDALRMRFEPAAGGWEQYNPPPGPADVLDCHDLSGVAPSRQQAAMDQATGQVHARLDLAAGPLLRAVLFGRGRAHRPLLPLAAPPLVIPPLSSPIPLSDLPTSSHHT